MSVQIAEFEINGKNIAVYWRGKTHKYVISVNYGERYIELSKAKGEAVIKVLKAICD